MKETDRRLNIRNAETRNYYSTLRYAEWLSANLNHVGRRNSPITARDLLCNEYLFGVNGIAVTSHPKVRRHLYFLIDDGWDIRSSLGKTLPEDVYCKPYHGSQELDEVKFPGYGDTPRERLKTLADKVKAFGWKGLGLFITPNVAWGETVIGREDTAEAYFKIRLAWSKYAGVKYWKIDWGTLDMSDSFRKKLMKWKNGEEE